MDPVYELLLDALRCAIADEKVNWAKPISGDDWLRLYLLAEEHKVSAMIAEAIHGSTAAEEYPERAEHFAEHAKKLTTAQAQRTADFLLVCRELRKLGLSPIVTKGIICRSLYPHPDERISVDEDMLIPPEDHPRYHSALTELGFSLVKEEEDAAKAFEVTYECPVRHLTIELHKQFFSPDSDAYADCNAPFEGAAERAAQVVICGERITTLSFTDHLLYLICHAYKHFLHGGVGIRQVSDICVFARHYAPSIDFAGVIASCKELMIEIFAAALFAIGEKHLGVKAPDEFAAIPVNEEHILADILSGGLYGMVDENRAHSGNITLNAVASSRKGKKSASALKSVFLPVKAMEGRFKYLRKRPWLLPVAWAQRIWGYLLKRGRGDVSPSESLRIGRERTELLREYGVIGRDNG